MITFLDTSALLNGRADDAKLYEKFYLSPLTLVELENIKTSSSKDDNIKFLARKAVRDILFNEKYEVCRYINDKKIDKFIKKHPELKDINDHKIIATAAILEKDRNEEVNWLRGMSIFMLLSLRKKKKEKNIADGKKLNQRKRN